MIRRTTYACRVHSSSSSTMGSSPSYYAQGKGGRVNRAGGDGIGRKINPAGRAEIYEHQSPKKKMRPSSVLRLIHDYDTAQFLKPRLDLSRRPPPGEADAILLYRKLLKKAEQQLVWTDKDWFRRSLRFEFTVTSRLAEDRLDMQRCMFEKVVHSQIPAVMHLKINVSDLEAHISRLGLNQLGAGDCFTLRQPSPSFQMLRNVSRRCITRGADISIPKMSLPSFLEERGKWETRVGEIAIKDGLTGREVTYDRLRPSLSEAGKALEMDECKTLLLLVPNCPEFIISMLGAMSKGIVVSTANPTYTADELTHQVKNSQADTILTIPALKETALEAAARCNISASRVKVLGEAGTEPFGINSSTGIIEPEFPINSDDDVAVLPYSSGTTGLPKGVMLTHYNLVANVVQLIDCPDKDVRLNMFEDTNVLCVLPLFHIYAMVVNGFCPLALGSKVVTIPKFEPELFLSTIQDEKITCCPVVPPIMIFLSKSPVVKNYDLSSLKTLYTAAAPCDAELQCNVTNDLGIDVLQAYGMTELSPAATVQPSKKMVEGSKEDIVFGSCGKALPATDLKLVDIDTGKECGPNSPGELYVRGPQVMKGYFNNKEATDSTMDGEWLKTGDIFEYDANENYFVVDRIKELIKVKGFQVAPAELEGILLTHPAVADCAVVSMKDERATELPHAYIVLKKDTEATGEDIKHYLDGKVTEYKRIAKVTFIDAIPKSASGKILRRLLRDTKGHQL